MTDWRPTQYQLERALVKTGELRKSPKPQWRDVRARLEAVGIDPADVVLGEWQSEGAHVMAGVITSRDARSFDLTVVYDYDPAGAPLEKGSGWVSHWRELASRESRFGPTGVPDTDTQAAIIARQLFEAENSADT